jgi:hypothetical protein
MRVLKGVFGCLCALPEPSVRFRINELRFVFVLSRQRSRVRFTAGGMILILSSTFADFRIWDGAARRVVIKILSRYSFGTIEGKIEWSFRP